MRIELLVFRTWTEHDHLMQWWGPKGCVMQSCSIDLRPGGVFHYGMRTPDGNTMWGKWVFREVHPPDRLVFVAVIAIDAVKQARGPCANTRSTYSTPRRTRW